MILRDEIMQASKIRSKSTYHRCIRELDSYGYVKYYPSKNAMTGSRIRIVIFKKKDSPKFELQQGHQNGHPDGTAEFENEFLNPINELPSGTACAKNGLPTEPFNKHINIYKHINLFSAENKFSAANQNEKIEKVYSKKETIKSEKNTKFTPPKLEEIATYFREKFAPEIEAQKFFNYFEANGWKIGGRSPMKKWTAAANNWILNAEKFNPKPKNTSNLHINQDKDYNIPL